MQVSAFVLAYFSYAIHGQRLQVSSEQSQGKLSVADERPELRTLAMLLVASNPAAGFFVGAPFTSSSDVQAQNRIGYRFPAPRMSNEATSSELDASRGMPGLGRREAASALLGLGLAAAHPRAALAEDKGVVRGTVTLPEGATGTKDTGALYVSARPEAEFGDILSAAKGGGNGNAPTVLLARYPAPITFPFEFSLKDPTDITPEGNPKFARSKWEDKDLIVVCRFDTDGVAATRGPDDLVGQSYARFDPRDKDKADKERGLAEIALKDRGVVKNFIDRKSVV